mmetsp:Transcript_2673/g.5987  ORF Transcript_2673/g.5987 Transcript_2673/m.5987 type:complete len:216 (+) Transcript_2673:257-904(+)
MRSSSARCSSIQARPCSSTQWPSFSISSSSSLPLVLATVERASASCRSLPLPISRWYPAATPAAGARAAFRSPTVAVAGMLTWNLRLPWRITALSRSPSPGATTSTGSTGSGSAVLDSFAAGAGSATAAGAASLLPGASMSMIFAPGPTPAPSKVSASVRFFPLHSNFIPSTLHGTSWATCLRSSPKVVVGGRSTSCLVLPSTTVKAGMAGKRKT